MAKPIIISGQPPRELNTEMVFVPIGTYCNRSAQRGVGGSIIEFQDGWRCEKHVMIRKCKVSVNSSVFEFLLRSIYGADMRWEELRRRWEAWAVIEGIGEQGFSDSEVLLIETARYDEAEVERKRREAERDREIMERNMQMMRKKREEGE